MSARLEGKVALITRAASGIGKATAERFAEEGAHVFVADINAAAGAAVGASLGAEFVTIDVTDPASWATVIEQLERTHGRLDVLVNNAGISPHDDVESFDLDTWRKIHSVVVESMAIGCHAALPLLRHSRAAAIVNLSSIAGLIGTPNYFSYGAAKAGVHNLTKSIAIYCANQRYPVRCNSIHPGSIDTPILDDDKRLHGEQAIAMRERAIPLKRLGQAVEVANAVLFLASDEASFITGTELIVDGGFTAR